MIVKVIESNAQTFTSGQDVQSHGCFHKHLRDAIQLNTTRRPLYSQLTQGASESFSDKLIGIEQSMLNMTQFIYNFDKLEHIYRDQGISITCEAFVEMQTVPGWGSMIDNRKPDLQLYSNLDPYILSRQIKSSLKKNESPKVTQKIILEALDKISGEPKFYCLTRHFLESMGRILGMSDKWEIEAKKRGLSSPRDLIKKMIRSHLLVFPQMSELDDQVSEIQARGVPLFCQDLPSIPIPREP